MCDRRMNPSVTSECIDGITVVTLNRPEVRNAVDADTARDLHAAFLAFDDDPASCVAVFHGAHGHFCAGWDLQAGARLHAAYTDHHHDLPMLLLAENPVAVDPTPGLAAEAAARNIPIQNWH
jgi:enoyl-CoA hydratase/carnithine racemase